MRSQITRRSFLRNLLIFGAGYGLVGGTGCGSPQNPDPTSAPEPTAVPTLPPTSEPRPSGAPAVATTRAPAATAVPSPTPRPVQLSVARGGSPEAITRAAIEALGGMSRFVKEGNRVVVKPNILTAAEPQYAVSTNPEVMATLVKMCLECGASVVQVFDFPSGNVSAAYQKSGIEQAVTAVGGRMEKMSQLKFKKTPVPQGRSMKEWSIYEDVFTADVVINAAIAKTHNLAGLTMGMKNLMGVIQDRGAFHSNIGQRLADLNSVVRPTLTVIDAVRILARNGPTGGSLSDVREMNTLIAGTDIVATDSYGATLFGKKGSDLSYVRIAAEMGLGIMDLSQVETREVRV